MKCTKCKTSIPVSAKFCPSCGSEISAVNSTELQKSAIQAQNPNQIVFVSIGIVMLILILVIALTRGNTGSNPEFLDGSQNAITDAKNNNSSNIDPGYYPDPDETVAPDPDTGVDITELPSGNSGSNSFNYGYAEAQDFINTGALNRALYGQFGGTEGSCKFVLDTFMAYHGGASTRQQYADFMLGCSVVVDNWY